ncbi:hypothetical protein GCM10029992_22130 [Glycomyces albus]
MNVSRTFASIVTGAAAAAAMATPAAAAEFSDAAEAVAPVTDDAGALLNAVTSEAGVTWGMTEGNGGDMGDSEGSNSSGDFGSSYGDAVFHDKQSALVASYGAPLVHVDARCVDAMGGIGGYATGVLGNSAKCNVKDVTQIDDSNGLIG